MMWKTTVQIGVFFDGGRYALPDRRWFLVAYLAARLELMLSPARAATIAKATGN